MKLYYYIGGFLLRIDLLFARVHLYFYRYAGVYKFIKYYIILLYRTEKNSETKLIFKKKKLSNSI